MNTVLLVILALILLPVVIYFTAKFITDLRYRFRPLLIHNKKTPFYKWRPEDLGGGMQPWGAVLRSDYVGDLPLYLAGSETKPCRFCAENNPEEGHTHLTWVKFTSHPQTWARQFGREGYISICTTHKNQVDFIITRMN